MGTAEKANLVANNSQTNTHLKDSKKDCDEDVSRLTNNSSKLQGVLNGLSGNDTKNSDTKTFKSGGVVNKLKKFIEDMDAKKDIRQQECDSTVNAQNREKEVFKRLDENFKSKINLEKTNE